MNVPNANTFSFVEPWRHVIAAGTFAYAGHNFIKWDLAMVDRLNKMREENELPPIRRSAIDSLRKQIEERESKE